MSNVNDPTGGADREPIRCYIAAMLDEIEAIDLGRAYRIARARAPTERQKVRKRQGEIERSPNPEMAHHAVADVRQNLARFPESDEQ